MLENIRLSFRGIWSHKMRSFLTMLGIIIGIAAIIAIVSTIQGTNEQIEKNLIGSGSNNVKVTLQKDGYDMDLSYETAPAGVTEVSAATLARIKELDHVKNAALYRTRQAEASQRMTMQMHAGWLLLMRAWRAACFQERAHSARQ